MFNLLNGEGASWWLFPISSFSAYSIDIKVSFDLKVLSSILSYTIRPLILIPFIVHLSQAQYPVCCTILFNRALAGASQVNVYMVSTKSQSPPSPTKQQFSSYNPIKTSFLAVVNAPAPFSF